MHGMKNMKVIQKYFGPVCSTHPRRQKPNRSEVGEGKAVLKESSCTLRYEVSQHGSFSGALI